MSENKAQLREQARLHRERIRPETEDIEQVGVLLRERVPLDRKKIVGAYWPTRGEFDVRYVMDDLMKMGLSVALPIATKSEKVMRFSKWDVKADLVKAEFGVFIPPVQDFVEPDILLVPFLAFDRRGYRLGQGGGHYDATIEYLRDRKPILAIGVGYAAQAVLFNLPVEPHDQRLDLIITPAGVHDFRN